MGFLDRFFFKTAKENFEEPFQLTKAALFIISSTFVIFSFLLINRASVSHRMKLQITPFKQDVKLKTRYAKNLSVPVAKVVFTTHVLFPTTQKQNKMIMQDLRNLLSCSSSSGSQGSWSQRCSEISWLWFQTHRLSPETADHFGKLKVEDSWFCTVFLLF